MDGANECNKLRMKNTIVLFPGGFKPLTGAHISLIQRYAKLPNVKQIKLLVGPKERDGITQDTAIHIAKMLLYYEFKVTVEASKWPSPVLTAFKEVEFATDSSTYTLASSTKGKDYERANDFISKHQPGQKYYDVLHENVEVISLPVNVAPILYKGRIDKNKGMPISASILREDLKNDNYAYFKTNYPNTNNNTIARVWEELQSSIHGQN